MKRASFIVAQDWLRILFVAFVPACALTGCSSGGSLHPSGPLGTVLGGRGDRQSQADADLPTKSDVAVASYKPVNYPIARMLNADRLVPSNDRRWAPEHAKLATADFHDDGKIDLHNVRNADWLTDTDCLVKYYDKTVDMRDLETVDFIVVPFNNNRSIAHTMLSFGFGRGDYVGLSVEVRKEEGEIYTTALGVARQFELVYVLADERDLLPVRVKQRASDVYIYRSVAAPDRVRALFADVLQRANQLAVQPEFYDTITNNCTTNLVRHVNKLHPGRIPVDYRVLLPGYSDQVAYDVGLLDTRFPFVELKRRAWANERIAQFENAPDFSAKIRR